MFSEYWLDINGIVIEGFCLDLCFLNNVIRCEYIENFKKIIVNYENYGS